MANLRNTVVTGSLRLASHGAGMVRTDANGTISTAAMTAGDLPSHNHDDRYYTESEINSLLSAKQDTATAITTSNIGSQSVNYANSAGTSGQVSGVSVSSLQMQYLKNTLNPPTLPYTCDIVVNGDADRFYAVQFWGGDQDVWRRIIIKRGYGEQAPWDPIGTGAHHGGLLLDWEGNFGGWGGAEYADRIRVFNESYTNVCADMFIWSHSMGYVFMLRGGGAIYHLFSDQPINGFYQSGSPDILYSTSTLSYDDAWSGTNQYDVPAPAPLSLAQVNSSRIDGLRTKKQSLFDGRYQPLENQRLSTGNSPSFSSVSANDVYTTGGWFRNHTNNSGIYWSNTGWHLMPENSGDFRFHSGNSSESAIRMETGGTTRGYVYANSSNEIGFLNQGRTWRLRVYSGGAVESYGDFRAPIFYDSADTAYYGDFASSGTSISINGGIVTTAPGGSVLLKHAVSEADAWIFQENAANWGLYWKNNPSGNHTFGGYTTIGAELFGMSAANSSGNGVLTTNFVGATSAYAQWMMSNFTGYIWSASTIFAAGEMRAPIFYDSNDTYYYVDPNSTSRLVSTRIIGGELRFQNGQYYNNLEYWGARMFSQDDGNGVPLYVQVQWVSGWYNALKIASGLDDNNPSLRTYRTTQLATDAGNVSIGGTASSHKLHVYGTAFATSDFRAPIFYDSNDTTYYGDFASTSWLRHLSVGDVNASNDGGWNARLNLTGSSHARLDVKSNSDGIITTIYSHSGQGVGRVGTWSNHPLAFMVNGGIAGYAYANYLQGVDSVRAPIFYDSADTGYYLDPNGTSNLLKLSALTMAYNGMNPMSASSPYVDRYNGSALYRNGTMGYGTTDFNVMFSNWGSGFIDSWSSPANAPGGSSHYVGHQVAHYNHQNSVNVYGYQMACAGEADNRFFWRSSWPTPRSWVEMIHSGTIGSQSVNFASSAGSVAWTNVSGRPTALSQFTNDLTFTSSDTLQSVTNRGASTSTSITAGDFYTAGWFRNSSALNGLYNSAYDTHFYASGTGQWNFATSNNSWIQIALRPANHQSTVRGYLYADTSNNVGLLTYDGGWGFRVDASKNAFVYGTDLTVGNSTNSNIYMTDTDETTRRIHCNSGRIGFLNSANAWGAWNDNTGNWSTDFSMYASSGYFYGSGSIRLGDMWGGAGLYRPSGSMVFGIENSDWIFSKGAVTQAYFAGGDGNLWMRWAGDWLSNLLGAKASTGHLHDDRYFFDYGFTTGYPGTEASGMPGNRSAFTYSNGAPLTGCIAHFGASGYGIQLNGDYQGDSFSMRSRNGDAGTWRPWKRLLTDYNYTAYSPTLTGGGASGTWGISITGNSATTSQRQFDYIYTTSYLESAGAVYGTIFYDNNDRGYYCDPNSTSRLNAIVYDNLYFAGDQTYGFLGRNVYADTVNGRGSDPLELNYYDGGSVIIGQGANGNKSLYAGALYDAGNRVWSPSNPPDSRYSRKDTSGQYLRAYYEYGSYLTSETPANLVDQGLAGGGLRVDFMHPSYTGSGGWNHVITWSGYNAYNMYQLGGHYDGGTGTNLWVRSEANHGRSSWTSWRRLLNTASDSYAANMNQEVRTDSSPTFAQVYSNGWFRTVSHQGLYNPTNDAHFYPNNASYGSWRIDGTRNGWHGLHFNSGSTLMMNGNETGVHREGYGWQFRWDNGRFYVHGNSYGGGTGHAVIHSGDIGSQSVNYANSAGSANSVAWGNVSGRPTTTSAFTNDNGFITSGSNVVGLYSSGWGNGNFTWYQTPGGLAPYGGSWASFLVSNHGDGSNYYNQTIIMPFWGAPQYSRREGGNNRGPYTFWSTENLDPNSISGNFYASGTITAGSDVVAYSDARIKTNIQTINNALEKVLLLRGVTYIRTDSDDTKEKIGVIAQEVQKVLPQVVFEQSNDLLGVSYGNMVGVLIEAIKEQQKQIEELKAKLV